MLRKWEKNGENLAMLEIGRVCTKLRGRDAGSKVVIVDLLKDAAVVEGMKTKKSKCNPRHLFPTDKKLDIKKGASHEELQNLLILQFSESRDSETVAKALGEGKASGKKRKARQAIERV